MSSDNNYKILHFNTKHADIYNGTHITYFLKNPIILDEEYILKVGCLNFYQSEKYINFIDIDDVEIDFSSNSGFITGNSIQPGSEGFWQFKIPNTDISVLFEVFDPLISPLYARIIQVIWNGGNNDPNVIFESSVIEIPNADVYRASNNDYGWYKTVASGPLKIKVNTIQQFLSVKDKVKITIDNLKYNNSKYVSSDKNFATIFDNIQFKYKNIQSRYYMLALEPQIINNIIFKIEDENGKPYDLSSDNSDIINFSLMLKKNNLF